MRERACLIVVSHQKANVKCQYIHVHEWNPTDTEAYVISSNITFLTGHMVDAAAARHISLAPQ